MERAIVLGGGIAGLLAARALSEHFARVIVVERDAAPPADGAPSPRKGAPQGRHAHALLVRGLATLEALFPGFTADAIRGGAVPANAARDASWGLAGARLAKAEDDLPVIIATRPFIEASIRARVLQLTNVSLRHDSEASDFIFDGARVTGVALTPHTGTPADTLAADLVIDARGRGSALPHWLQRQAYSAPPEDMLEIGVGYTTIQFRDHDAAMHRAGLGDRAALIVGATPDCPRGGVLHRVEGGRVEVSLAGYQGNHPPATLEGFVEFAGRLALPDLHRVVANADPCSEPAVFRVPRTTRRHYERLKRFPAGILPIGDAICAFNPIFAQGMAVAALQAAALRHILAGQRTRWQDGPPSTSLAPSFFSAAARIIDPAWAMAKSNDLLAPHLHARQTFRGHLLSGWIARVIRAGATDAEIARRFIRVASLVDPPQALLSPGTVRRVLLPPRHRSEAEPQTTDLVAPSSRWDA